MRVTIAAVGRLKDAERELCDRYVDRIAAAGRGVAVGPLAVLETPESRMASAAQRRAEEAARLLKATAGSAEVVVALDSKGRSRTSESFAALLAEHRDRSVGCMAFLVGGPDGHGQAVLDTASLVLSLGLMTLPHGLARVVLAEQIYRATTILSGHPYHRA